MTAHHYQNKTDEWMTPAWVVAKCFELLNPPKGSKILMPYDTDKSEFVKYANVNGFEPVYGFRDFIPSSDKVCDYIITNPPYSIKDNVIDRCYQYEVPTALVLPIDCLGGVKRHEMFKKYGHPSVWIPNKRISYINEQGESKAGVGFHSIILLLNTGQSKIIWG